MKQIKSELEYIPFEDEFEDIHWSSRADLVAAIFAGIAITAIGLLLVAIHVL